MGVSKLRGLIDQLTYPKKHQKDIVLYTGLGGKREFDFAMFLYAVNVKGEIKFKYSHNYYPTSRSKSFAKYKKFNKLEFKYLNLIEKHGLYKIKIYSDKKLNVHLYKGTELIMQADSFNDVNKYLKENNVIK